MNLPLQDSAERAAHDLATDRTAERTADLLADIGDDAADHLVGDGARHAACNDLTGGELVAAGIGAEDRADDGAELAEEATAASACVTTGIGRRRGTGYALL